MDLYDAAQARREVAKEEVFIQGVCLAREFDPEMFQLRLAGLRRAAAAFDACRNDWKAEAAVQLDPHQIAALIADGGPAHEQEAA